jgi:hypothetical protein
MAEHRPHENWVRSEHHPQENSSYPEHSSHSENSPTVVSCCCFVMGTHILSSKGEVPVERLAEGDRLVTFDGREAVIKWIGWRSVNLAAHPTPKTMSPIRFARGSIAENTPHRDLHVSPEHAMYLNDMLIPASALVNGTTIAQVPMSEVMSEVVYYHVELEGHDAIIAEGAASESFLDFGGVRSSFANASGAVLLHPDFGAQAQTAIGRGRRWLIYCVTGAGSRLYKAGVSIGVRRLGELALQLSLVGVQHLTGACAPRINYGPKVEEARRQLAARADVLDAAATPVVLKLSA